MKRLPSAGILLTLLAASWCLPASSAAQVTEVPPFVVAVPTLEAEVRSIDVAVAADGTLLFAWSEQKVGAASGKVLTRRFSAAGTALAPAARIDTSGNARTPSVGGNDAGGFAAVWPVYDHGVYDVRARFLSPAGIGLGAADLQLDVDQTLGSEPAVAALPTGTVFVWRETSRIWGQRFDQTGAALAPPFEVGTGVGSGFTVDVDAASDGSFVVVWDDGKESHARLYGPSGAPLGAAVTTPGSWRVLAVAESPLGGFVASGIVVNGTGTDLTVRGFDASGGLLWETPVGAAGGSWKSDIVCDALGDVAVAWSASPQGLHVSGFSPTGVPLGAPVALGNESAFRVRAARLPNGTSFVVAWHRSVSEAKATVLSLCAPGAPECGDGTVAAVCEQCDAGAANSDTTPNACRSSCRQPRCGDGVVDDGETCDDGNLRSCDGCSTACAVEAAGWSCGDAIVAAACGEVCDDGAANNDALPDACRSTCRPAGCGDGVVDAGEGCDDGNHESCDGCSAECVPEIGSGCGDGVLEPGCGEACDDGNLVTGDGCSASCTAELVPGRGTPRTDCFVEWSVDNAANLPLLDGDGHFSGVQTCHDGDPRCDFDGGQAGSCTFHLAVCVNATNLPACEPPERLARWTVTTPSINKAAHDPVAAAVRSALLATVPAAIIGPTFRDLCSPMVAIVVPLRQPGDRGRKLVIKTRAEPYSKLKDKDQITLTCLP